MAYAKYTEAELFLFKQKDKRIMWQSIFSSLCNYYAQDTQKKSIPDIMVMTTGLVKGLEEDYPTEEAEKTPEYKDKELDEAIASTEKRLEQLKNIKSGQPF